MRSVRAFLVLAAFFAFTLVVGLAYVWKKGALEMESD